MYFKRWQRFDKRRLPCSFLLLSPKTPTSIDRTRQRRVTASAAIAHRMLLKAGSIWIPKDALYPRKISLLLPRSPPRPVMPVDFRQASNVQIQNSPMNTITGNDNVQRSCPRNVNSGTTTNITANSNNDSSIRNGQAAIEHPCRVQPESTDPASNTIRAYLNPYGLIARDDISTDQYTLHDSHEEDFRGSEVETAGDAQTYYLPRTQSEAFGKHKMQLNPFRAAFHPVQAHAASARPRLKANNPFLRMLDLELSRA